MSEPAHSVEVEGTTERLQGVTGFRGVSLRGPTARAVGETRYAVDGLATDEGISELRALGLEVRIVEEASSRAQRLEAMAEQIRQAREEE